MDQRFNENFMNEVQNYPLLCDKTKKEYKDKNMVKNAWNEVAQKMDLENGMEITFIDYQMPYCEQYSVHIRR